MADSQTPSVEISAALISAISEAASALAMATAGRMTVSADPVVRERHAERWGGLADQADAVLAERCPAWTECRAARGTGGDLR
jgi:hypothetical protein